MKACIQIAGLLQIGIAAANVPALRLLGCRENLAKLSPIIRQIFVIHAAYIIFMLLGLGAMSLIFADDLTGASALGTCASGFLAAFWFGRVVIQLGYYDCAIKRKYRAGHVIFTASFLYLGVVYLAAVFWK